MTVAHLPVPLEQSGSQRLVNLFLDQEVGHHCVDLHTGRKCHRADGAVRHDVDVVDLGHVGDLLKFADAAGVGAIGLDIGHRLLLEYLAEFPAR